MGAQVVPHHGRVGDVSNRQTVEPPRMTPGYVPTDYGTKVVPGEVETLIAESNGQPEDIIDKHIHLIAGNSKRFIAQVVPSLVRHNHPESSLRQGLNLRFPAKPGIRKSVQEKNGFTIFWSSEGSMQANTIR